MSTIAPRQYMIPVFFFAAGFGLLAVSFLPNMQQRRLPSYPPSTTTPVTPAPATVAPVTAAPASPAQTRVPAPIPAGAVSPGTKASVAPLSKPGTKRGTAASAAPGAPTFIIRPGGQIVATTPHQILHENPVTIGREDPFKSLLAVPKKSTLPPPPPFPGAPVVSIPGAQPAPGMPTVKPAKPTPPPATPPPLKVGLSLQGLVTGDEEPAAILNVDGNTQLVRVGDVIRRPGYVVTITAISERDLSIKLSDGKGHTEVLKTE